jgi:Tol biopolymer transport system component
LKFLRLILTALIVLGVLSGCSYAYQPPDYTVTPAQSTGGEAHPGEKINLKDIDIITDQEQTVITLSMLSGSRKAGYAESKLTKLPEYEINQLEQPQRLMIRLHDISFWEYDEKASWEFSDFVLGMFREVPANDNSLIIYIQLSHSAEYTVEEAEGDLILRLSPGSENEGQKYFCLSNSFSEYQDGTWPKSVDMTPVLCMDLKNILLISRPFDTEEDADVYKEAAAESLKQVLPNNEIYVAQLGKNILPDFSSKDFSAAVGNSVVMKQGALMDTPVLLQNGKYLASAVDGRIAFSRRYSSDETDFYPFSEKLWIMDPNGRIQNIDVPDFNFIDEAAFSYDGKFLGILDVSTENSVLYVYDFDSGEFVNLGEEGFGSYTASFAWSDENNIIYALTGHGPLQIKRCKFSSDGTFSIGEIEEIAGFDGKLDVSLGRLFVADNTGGSGKIYKLTAKRQRVSQGIDFSISPDGKTMLVLEAGNEEVLTSLKLCDIETGESTYIVENADISDFYFSQDGGKVYYMDASAGDPDGEYNYGLFLYDIATADEEQIALCNTGDFAPSLKPGEIYLIYNINDTENSFYATYSYDLNK